MSKNLQIMFWDRRPGKFVNKFTGEEINVIVNGQPTYPKFTGSEYEWYETLVETIIDMRNTLQRKAFDEFGTCVQEAVNVRCDAHAWEIINKSILFKAIDNMSGQIDWASLTLQKDVLDKSLYDGNLMVESSFKIDDRRHKFQGLIKVMSV